MEKNIKNMKIIYLDKKIKYIYRNMIIIFLLYLDIFIDIKKKLIFDY